ncbi:MAG: hypothetical protein EOL91_11035 [Actinobacteria bacterium]|nr:hypothetical protein [Actinomycetota bacterium]
MKSVRWVVALLVVMLVLVAVALAFGGGDDPPAASPGTHVTTGKPPSTDPATPTSATPAQDPPGMLTVARTADPDAYADSVAALVFSMDPRAFEPEDYRAVLLGEADPMMSDSGLADLERTVEERIPDATQWARMRANEQWSTWSTTAVWEPETWAEVVTDGLAEPGWVIRNVTGTQTTSYVDGGGNRTAVSEPTLTIAMRCPAPDAQVEQCHLVLIGTSVLP